MRPGGRDVLADPTVLAWDAVARGDTAAPPECDTADFALLRSLHQSDRVPMPAPSFFGDLEEHLRRSAPLAQLAIEPDESPAIRSAATVSHGATLPLPLARVPRRPLVWIAVAAALAIALVGLLVAYEASLTPAEPPAIPAAVIADPTLETLARFDVDPPKWGMPDAPGWQHFEGGLFEVAPGKPFTTNAPWFIASPGPLALTALSSEITITPAGPALLFLAQTDGQTPVEIAAGETVTLGLNDTITYSSRDTAEGNNPGAEPALVLYSLAGISDPYFPNDMQQSENTTMRIFDDIETSLEIPTAGAIMVLQRIDLAPYDLHVFDVPKEPRLLVILDPKDMNSLRVYEGALETLSPSVSSQTVYGPSQLRYLSPGPHTLANLGEETVELYFLTVEPAPDAGTPIA